MPDAQGAESLRKVPVVYQGLDDLPILFSNIFLVQSHEKSEFIVSFGQFAPPLILPGSEADRKAQTDKIQFVTATMLSRMAFTEDRFRELVALMAGYLAQYDERKKRGGEAGAD